jgi:outer membrane immunogenic protein
MKHLASVVLIGSALLAGSASVRAADLPLKAPPPPPILSWTGFYVGGNLGAMHGNADYDPVCPTLNAATCPLLLPFFATNTVVPGIGPVILFIPNPFSTLPGGGAHDTSAMGGGQAGYNWQVNKWVFGLEGDIDATHIRASLTRSPFPVVPGFPPGFFGTVTANSTFNSDWMASLRGRVGITWNRALFYGTAGVAFADSSVNTAWTYIPPANAIPALSQGVGPTGARSSQNLVGWTAGVGGEWMVNTNVSVGAEYRHSDFGTHSYLLGFDVNVPSVPVFTNVHYTTDQVTIRANWHFH